MDNLIKDFSPLELYCWLDPAAELPGWDILKGGPFGATLAAPNGGPPAPDIQFLSVQNYFAEYHLEFFRQRRYKHFPSRLHALLLFATRVDAEIFREKHGNRVFGKQLNRARSEGTYTVSFHDASWLDYLRLPHSLSLDALDEVANYYWSGKTVEDVGLSFMDQAWHDTPVIEALFQGSLAAAPEPTLADFYQSGWLPGFNQDSACPPPRPSY